MTGAWIQLILAAGCLFIGLFFMILAVFGVNRFKKPLNRMHAQAIGDTLGILFVILSLILMRGFSMDSLKLFLGELLLIDRKHEADQAEEKEERTDEVV